MTGTVFEVETIVLAHSACVLEESGILLTEFAAAHSSITLGSSKSLKKAELPKFILSISATNP